MLAVIRRRTAQGAKLVSFLDRNGVPIRLIFLIFFVDFEGCKA